MYRNGKGGTSWKEDLREVIEEGKQVATTPKEFIEYLKLYGVEITKSGKDYSYLHPHKQKPIRGKRLGENYSKEAIEHFIGEKGHGRNARAAYAIAGNEREGQERYSDGFVERGVGDIEREIEQLDRTAEQAHRGYAFGYSDDGVRADGNDGKSRAGDQSDGGKDQRAFRQIGDAQRRILQSVFKQVNFFRGIKTYFAEMSKIYCKFKFYTILYSRLTFSYFLVQTSRRTLLRKRPFPNL